MLTSSSIIAKHRGTIPLAGMSLDSQPQTSHSIWWCFGGKWSRLNLAWADPEEELPLDSCRRAALLSPAECEQRIPLPRGLMIPMNPGRTSNSRAGLREVQWNRVGTLDWPPPQRLPPKTPWEVAWDICSCCLHVWTRSPGSCILKSSQLVTHWYLVNAVIRSLGGPQSV